jgi:hypothetical protein
MEFRPGKRGQSREARRSCKTGFPAKSPLGAQSPHVPIAGTRSLKGAGNMHVSFCWAPYLRFTLRHKVQRKVGERGIHNRCGSDIAVFWLKAMT